MTSALKNDDLKLTLTRTQGEAFRYAAGESDVLRRTIISRPKTSTYLLIDIRTKSEAKSVIREFDSMIENLTDAERTGPSVKMAYALGRHVSKIKQHFGL